MASDANTSRSTPAPGDPDRCLPSLGGVADEKGWGVSIWDLRVRRQVRSTRRREEDHHAKTH
jgi:hypothetical protein